VICRVRSSFPDRNGSCKLFQAVARLHGERGKESDSFPSGEHARPISIDRWFPRVVPEDIDSCEFVGRFNGETNETTTIVGKMTCYRSSCRHRTQEDKFSAEMYYRTIILIVSRPPPSMAGPEYTLVP
jgi:hypothetical protein